MPIKIKLAGNKKVDVEINGFTVHTDQKIEDGGDNSYPTPLDLFFASIGACAGHYINVYCQTRNIPTEGIEIEQEMFVDELTRTVAEINLIVHFPPDFPEQNIETALKAAGKCSVKKHIENAPEILLSSHRA